MGAPGKDGASSPAPGATIKPGSRIKLQWTTTTLTTSTEDGASVETVSQSAPQFFDTKLDTVCAMGPAEDGVQRCLPTTAAGLSFFSDSGCTQPVAYQAKQYMPPCGGTPPPLQPPRPFWRLQAPPRRDQCDPIKNDQLFALGPEIPAPAVLYGYQGTPDCKPLSADNDSQVRMQALRYFSTSHMSPIEFVAMKTESKSSKMP